MKFPVYLCIAALTVSLCSCHWANQKSSDAIKGTGELVGKAGSEFASGVAKGVEKTFSKQVVLSPALVRAGLGTGKITAKSEASGGNDNMLSAYLIFNESLDRDITVKLFTEDSLEYGRVTRHVKGNKGTAAYVDFLFDRRTDIDRKGKITIE